MREPGTEGHDNMCADQPGGSTLIERIAAVLRAPERVSEGFDARVMSAVRETQPELTPQPMFGLVRGGQRGAWWRRPSIQLSPVGAFAMAAGLAAIVFLGADLRHRGATADASRAVAAADTVHLVRFVFMDENARQVTIAGSFNHWAADDLALHPTGTPGVWTITVPLPPGQHEYAFVVDGERWTRDPAAFSVTDEFGMESSILSVGGNGTSS